MHAVVLTGRTLPGHSPDAAWPAVAKLFKLEPDPFKARVLARCPLTIRETADESEAQSIVAAIAAQGAQAELVEADGSKWSVEQNGRIAGPVPLTYLRRQYEARGLTGEVRVKGGSDGNWTTLACAIGEAEITLDLPPEPDDTLSDELPPPLPQRSNTQTLPT